VCTAYHPLHALFQHCQKMRRKCNIQGLLILFFFFLFYFPHPLQFSLFIWLFEHDFKKFIYSIIFDKILRYDLFHTPAEFPHVFDKIRHNIEEKQTHENEEARIDILLR